MSFPPATSQRPACRFGCDKLFPVPRWNRETITAEILDRYESGQDLSYSGCLKQAMPLLRAAVRQYGSWSAAIAAAGLDYEALRRYKTWSNERILARIQELARDGKDLSWRNVAGSLDPNLAAAATKPHHFGSWRAAITAAGLDYDTIRRYRRWTDEEVLRQIQVRVESGLPLNAKALERESSPLLTAARRRFPAWHTSLTAAGVDFRDVVLRPPAETK